MRTQPWVVAAGLSGLPEDLWRRYMALWMDWAVVHAEGSAEAQRQIDLLEASKSA